MTESNDIYIEIGSDDQLTLHITLLINNDFHRYEISTDAKTENYWQIIEFMKNNLSGDFSIRTNNAVRHMGHIQKIRRALLNTNKLKYGTICHDIFFSNFGSTMNNAVKAFTKKLVIKYLTLLMIGIVQRLDKNNIPREITNIIFQFCNVNVNLSTNRKFTLNGRELLMII
jgi:hypothetical protein